MSKRKGAKGPREKVIRDEREVVRWYQEGYTYKQIADMHEEKYGVRPSLSMINWVRRWQGVPPRITHNPTLMPWALEPEHRRALDARALRVEARLRAGKDVSEHSFRLWRAWRKRLDESGAVVDYDPVEGFRHVPRREGVDKDLIRVPDVVTTRTAYDSD